MHRRDALNRIAAAGLGAAATASWVQQLTALAQVQASHVHTALASAQAAGAWVPKVFNQHQHQTVAVLAELIIPQTDTPGAKGALVDRFIDALLEKAPVVDRRQIVTGLGKLDARSRALFRVDFVGATPPQQTDLLTRLSAEGTTEARDLVDFFTVMKSLTITGYYTSEIGMRDELGDSGQLFLPAYEGCTHPEHQQ